MAAHWASATFKGWDSKKCGGILYEGADLVSGFKYRGVVGDKNGTNISSESLVGSIALPAEVSGETITLNLYGGALVPNVLIDTISVAIPARAPTPGVRGAYICSQKFKLTGLGGQICLYHVLDGVRTSISCSRSGGYADPYDLKTAIFSNTDSVEFSLEECDEPCGVISTGPFLCGETVIELHVPTPGEPTPPPEECAQEIIIRFADDPEKVADIFYTIKGGTPNIPAKSATQFTIQCPANQTVRINVGVTEDTIDSFTDFYACTGAVEEIPLLVAAPPGEAYLTLTVVDKDDLPIEGATVTVDGATGTTDASGIYKTTAVIGTELTVTVTKDGYETGTLTDTMPEGGLPIKIMLVKIGELITQLIFVKKAGDFQAEYIEGATVTVDGKACEELPDGLYSIEIAEGIEATVEVKAEGYKDKTEAFTTTSMASLLISLEPSIPEGESEQAFTLVDADGNPIEGATITVGEESCVTDSEGKCVITAPIGEATTATITKPGYEDTEMAITPGEDGDEYSVTLPKAEKALTLPYGVKDDLDAGTVSDEIKDAFAAAGIPLSDAAVVEKIDEDTWKVTDGEDVYSVLEEEGELNVYPGGGAPTPPEVPPDEMTQHIIVHEEGIYPFKYIEGATVKVDGALCTDDGGGHYFINLTIGATVTATVAKEGYDTVEHTFTVTEGENPVIPLPLSLASDRFEITITNLNVVDDVKTFAVGCYTPSLNPLDWTAGMIGGKLVAYKKLSRYEPTETVIFQASDGLTVGDSYAFTQGREYTAPIVGDFFVNLGLPAMVESAQKVLSGVQKYTITALSLPIFPPTSKQASICNMLGVVDCTAFWVETGIELFITQHAWSCILEGEDVYGNPCTPSAFDWGWVAIDIVGIIPFGMLGKSVTSLTKFSKAMKAAGKLDWLEDAENVKLFLKAESASGATGMGDALKFAEAGDMAGFTTWCNNAIAAGKTDDMARAMAKAIDEGGVPFKRMADYAEALKKGHMLDAWTEVIADATKGLSPTDVTKFLDGIVTPKNIGIIEHGLASFPTEFKEAYALYRFSKPEFITALKEANQFDAIKAVLMSSDSDDLLKVSAKGFTDDELTAIYKNLDDAGATELTTKLKALLGVVFDFAAIQGRIMAKVDVDDWVGALKEWDLGVAGDPHNVFRLEARLTEMSPPVQRIHNIMRYTDPEYIKAIDEAPGQLQKGFTFLVNHLTTAGEPTSYLDVIKALSPEQYSAVIRNLDTVDAHGVAKLVEGLDVTVDAAKLTGRVDGLNKVGAVLEDTVKVGSQPGATDYQKQLMKAAKQSFKEAMDNIPPSLKDGDLMKEFVEGINKIKNPKAHKRGQKFIDIIKGLVEYSSKQKWDDLTWMWRFGHYIKIAGLPCFMLFILEETYQILGFTTMASREMARGFMGQTMAQRQDVIDNYQGVVNWQKVMFAAALPVNAIVSILCFFMSPAYILYTASFYKNVEQNQWHVDQLQLGMDVTTGFGNVKLPIRANMHGVQIMVDMMPQAALAGPYVTQYPILLREDTQQYTIKGWKKGYIQKDPVFITATAANVLPYGEPLSEVEVILIPESQLMDDKPIDIPTGTGYQGINYDDIPVSMGGNCPDDEWWGGYGDINCKTTGGGAEIYLISAAGVRKYAGKTNAIVESIPIGDYIVEFIKEGWRCTDCPNCRVPVHVGVTPVNAWCTMAEISAFEPVAKLIVKPSTFANTGEELSFGAEGSEPGTGASFKEFVFDFGDGTPSVTITSLAIPVPQKHAYAEAGDYTAKLTITNSDGLIGEDFVYVTISEAEGTIEFTRVGTDNLDQVAPEIWFKQGASEWQIHTQKGPTGSYPKPIKFPVGTYDVEYRYLDVTRCGKTVTVKADEKVSFSCPLKLYLPDQTVVEGVNDVRTTVTAVKDGDTIYTAFTDALPPRPEGSQRVRMVGYDAPDMAILDTYATDMLKKLLPVGTSVTLKIVSYNVLGHVNRVLAGVIKDDGTDVNRKMIESCLVSEPEKTAYTKDLYFNWELEFSNYWGDPKSDRCLATTDPTDKLYISLIVNTSEGTVQINNRWLPVYAIVRMFKGGQPIDKFTYYTHKHIATNETSPSYGYKEAQAVKLYVSSKEIDDKNTGFEIESDIIGEVPPDTYVVTFTSNPPGAKVSTIPGTITISRLTSILKSQRDSTPVSRFYKRQRLK